MSLFGLCLFSLVSLFFSTVVTVEKVDIHGQSAVLGTENGVTWTLNMFEMDLGTHRGICLNGTSPTHHKSWPQYIDHPDPPPNPELDTVRIKFLALYFPQWYPAAENDYKDDWRFFYNPNFTHNRNKAPMTRPLNNVYYDPRCAEVRRTQAALAKKYLLDGFIYYFYFAENEWVLKDVNQQMLLDGEPNTDFAFYWVNEHFGRRPTMYDQVELLSNTLLPFVSHPRYITINGRPLFYLYVTTKVPPDFIRSLQDKLIEKGVPKLYIVASIQKWRRQTVRVEFADAYAEFPPNIGPKWLSHEYTRWDHTEDYHLGVALNFDNTPRMSEGNPRRLPKMLTKERFLPDNPPTPKEFRERCIARVHGWYEKTKAEKVVLFFAWNEWSEQAALEPSDLNGYGYLEAIRDCRMNASYLEVPPSNHSSSLPLS
jgi:hypothetical protein